MSVWALLPWLCLLAELLRAPARAAAVRRAGGASSALQFLGGHPSSSFQVLVAVALFWVVRALAAAAAARARPGAAPGHARRRAGGRHRAGGDHADPVRRAARRTRSTSTRARRRPRTRTSRRATCSGVFLHDWWGRGSRAPLEFAVGARGARLLRGRAAADAGRCGAGAAPRPRADRRGRRGRRGAGGGHRASRRSSTSSRRCPGFDAARNGRLAVISVLCVAVLAGWGARRPDRRDAVAAAAPAAGARRCAVAARRCRS